MCAGMQCILKLFIHAMIITCDLNHQLSTQNPGVTDVATTKNNDLTASAQGCFTSIAVDCDSRHSVGGNHKWYLEIFELNSYKHFRACVCSKPGDPRCRIDRPELCYKLNNRAIVIPCLRIFCVEQTTPSRNET